MRQALDWAGLLRAGLQDLRLAPAQFWQLTPVELRIMLGHGPKPPALSRARLAELRAAFPDHKPEAKDDGS